MNGANPHAQRNMTSRIEDDAFLAAFLAPPTSAPPTRVSASGSGTCPATAQGQTAAGVTTSGNTCPASGAGSGSATCSQLPPGLITPPLQGAPNRHGAAYYHGYHHSHHLTSSIAARLSPSLPSAQSYFQQCQCPYLAALERLPQGWEAWALQSNAGAEEENVVGSRLLDHFLEHLDEGSANERAASSFWLTGNGDLAGEPEMNDVRMADVDEQQAQQVPLSDVDYAGVRGWAEASPPTASETPAPPMATRSRSPARNVSLLESDMSADEASDAFYTYESDDLYEKPSMETDTAFSPVSGSSSSHASAKRHHGAEQAPPQVPNAAATAAAPKHLSIPDDKVAFYVALTSPNISKARYLDIISKMKRKGVIDTGNRDWAAKLVQVRASRPVPLVLARAMTGEQAMACSDRAVLVASAQEKDTTGHSVVTECEQLGACRTVPTEWLVPVDGARRLKSISLDQLLPSLDRKIHQSNNVLLFVLLKERTRTTE